MLLRNLILTVLLGVLAACDSGTSVSTSTESRTYVYDANGRLIVVNNHDSAAIQYTYDPAGNILTQKNKVE